MHADSLAGGSLAGGSLAGKTEKGTKRTLSAAAPGKGLRTGALSGGARLGSSRHRHRRRRSCWSAARAKSPVRLGSRGALRE
jgi:hypothetical protein